MQVKIEGLEDEVRRILADVLAEREDDPWYTVPEAAAYTGTTEGNIRNLRSSRKLFSPSPPGHKLRFRRSELDRYIEAQS
jgi:excisionase family DNA binding protein